MEITLKLSEILNLNQILKNIIDDKNLKMDSLFKFQLLGIMKTFEPYVTNFDVIRNEKVVEYGKKTDDGKASIDQNDKEAMEKFMNDISKVVNGEITINMAKLKAKDVFDKGLTAEYLVGLYPIIEQ